jgi:MFS family permease
VSVPNVTAPSEKAQAAPRPGVAMAVIMTGVLMTAVDTTIVVLALPEIQRGLHVALSAVVWVIISFLLVITLLATQVGRLGDMFGRVRMYEMGFAVFVLGSLACALAWNEPSIIAFLVLQGIGGAFTSGLHAAFYASMGFMVLAADLSALRVRSPHA